MRTKCGEIQPLLTTDQPGPGRNFRLAARRRAKERRIEGEIRRQRGSINRLRAQAVISKARPNPRIRRFLVTVHIVCRQTVRFGVPRRGGAGIGRLQALSRAHPKVCGPGAGPLPDTSRAGSHEEDEKLPRTPRSQGSSNRPNYAWRKRYQSRTPSVTHACWKHRLLLAPDIVPWHRARFAQSRYANRTSLPDFSRSGTIAL